MYSYSERDGIVVEEWIKVVHEDGHESDPHNISNRDRLLELVEASNRQNGTKKAVKVIRHVTSQAVTFQFQAGSVSGNTGGRISYFHTPHDSVWIIPSHECQSLVNGTRIFLFWHDDLLLLLKTKETLAWACEIGAVIIDPEWVAMETKKALEPFISEVIL